MVDVTSELQQMADGAARQARPLAAAEVIRRGDRSRRRFITRLSLGGLSVTVVAAVIIGVIALPTSRQASHPAQAQLAAWTVVKQADGKISLTLRQFRDPAALQAMLRADGVPVSVTLASQPNPACREYPVTGNLHNNLLIEVVALPVGRPVVAIINPSVLPTGAGIQMLVTLGPHDTVLEGAVGLVVAGPQCTGS